jgi:hypothetical protein
MDIEEERLQITATKLEASVEYRLKEQTKFHRYPWRTLQ